MDEDAEVRVDVARRSVERLEQLLELSWGDAGEVTRSQVKLNVTYLRDKVGWTAADSPIEAVRRFGYRYRAAGSSSVLAA